MDHCDSSYLLLSNPTEKVFICLFFLSNKLLTIDVESNPPDKKFAISTSALDLISTDSEKRSKNSSLLNF